MQNDIKKILIIRLSALGDTIHTLPLACAIKRKYPDVLLDWVVEDKASVFIIDNPLIDNVYEIPRKKWKNNKNKLQNLKEFFEIIKKIKNEKYDIVIDTQQLFKSGIIMGLSEAKRRITLDGGREFSFLFANEIIKTGMKQFEKDFHVVKRNLKIAEYLNCEADNTVFVLPDFSDKYSKNIKKITDGIDKTKKTIVIAPSTTWENKLWTVEGWKDVINAFKNECNIIITASAQEKHIVENILSEVKERNNIYNLSGMTNVQDLVYIYKNSDVVITPDSGSCHIAWAVNHPYVVSLFFSTSAGRTGPYGEKYISLQSELSCSPCMKKKCSNGNFLNGCTKKTDSEKVINIVKKVLQVTEAGI